MRRCVGAYVRMFMAPRDMAALVACLGFLSLFAQAEAAPLTWREIAPGMAYTKLAIGAEESPGTLHAFRIDPARLRVDCLLARDFGGKTATAQAMVTRSKALLAINGGFFSPEFEPLGLRVQGGRQRNPLKAISWWGIFFFDHGAPHIAARGDFVGGNGIQMAVQSGPRLVVDGTIPALKPGIAERSAIGISRRGEIVIAITERAPIETRTLAELFRRPAAAGGLDCPNALNLDGGGSSQLYVKTRALTLHIPGFTPVTDAVAVFAR